MKMFQVQLVNRLHPDSAMAIRTGRCTIFLKFFSYIFIVDRYMNNFKFVSNEPIKGTDIIKKISSFVLE